VRTFPELSIEQCCTRVTSGGTPRRNNPNFYRGGTIPWVKTGELKDRVIDPSAIGEWITEEAIKNSSAKLLPKNTVLMAMYGDGRTIGSVGLVRSPVTCNQACCAMIPNPDVCDARFLFYAIRHYRNAWIKIAHGGAQRNLSGTIIRERKIAVPAIPIQKRIADILGAYDDLIEVNRRRMALLEEMARRLFEEWFVSFRFPGYGATKRIESTRGPIPENWRVCRVRELAERQRNGRVYREADCQQSGSAVVIDQSSDEALGYHSNEPDHHATPDDPIVIFGDHTCKMQLLVSPFSIGPNTIAFKADGAVNIYYLFSLVRGLTQTKEYKRHWNELMDNEVLVAPRALTMSYAASVKPLFQLQENLQRQCRVLRSQRDFLLPRMISGRLSAFGAERELEAVA
jgi:type I restriction enzyme S subunit